MKQNDARLALRQLCCLGLPTEELIAPLLKALRDVVPADSAGFFWVDADGHMTNLYAERMLPPDVLTAYFRQFYDTPGAGFRVAFLARAAQSDPVTAATPDLAIQNSGYYQEILRRLDAHHVLYGIVREQGSAVGQISLYRPRGTPAFSAADRQALNGVMHYVAHGLARRSVPDDLDPAVPRIDSEDTALVLLDRDGQLVSCDPAGVRLLYQALLDRIPAPTAGGATPAMDTALKSLADRLTRALQPHSLEVPRLATKTCWGHFTLRAYLLPHAGHDRELLAVQIVRQEVQELRLIRAMNALKLPAQQREVAIHLARGHSNQEIAEQMGISANTAAYHVKQLFARLDAHDRHELIGSLLAEPVRRPASAALHKSPG